MVYGWRRLWLWPAALMLVACSLDPTDEVASRFAVAWTLAAAGEAVSCAESGVDAIVLVSELVEPSAVADAGPADAPDAGVRVLRDRFPCASGAGTTGPLPPGGYRVSLEAVAETDAILGVSAGAEVQLRTRQTVPLEVQVVQLTEVP